MACPVNYPTVAEVLPCVKEVYQIVVVEKAIAENKAEVAKHAWAIVGAGLEMGLGDPDNPPLIGAEITQLSDDVELIVTKMNELVPEESEGLMEAKAIPWALLGKLALMLLQQFVFKEE